MKFKITRSEFDMLAIAFEGKKEKDYEINLEPVDQTAKDSMMENEGGARAVAQSYD